MGSRGTTPLAGDLAAPDLFAGAITPLRCNGRTRPILLNAWALLYTPFAFGRRLEEDLQAVPRTGLHTTPGSLCRGRAAVLGPVVAFM
jgi:hypothetical protein